jgi:hypothetical protein
MNCVHIGEENSLKKLTLSLLTISVVILMITSVYANGGGQPGLSPGFWKHNVRVALEYPGEYSTPHEGEDPMTYDYMVFLAKIVTGETDPTDALETALTALTATGPGSDETRLGMANAFNAAAGYTEYSDD